MVCFRLRVFMGSGGNRFDRAPASELLNFIPTLHFIHSAGSRTCSAVAGRRHGDLVTSNTVLTMLDDAELREAVERVAAAVGLRVVPSPAVLTRKTWSTVSAVVLDEPAARRCEGMPRRAGLILVCGGEPCE